MSQLEQAVQPVLTQFLETPKVDIALDTQQILARWTWKTALVAMLMSSDEDRTHGYGVPRREYRHMFRHRALSDQPRATQIWVDHYVGGLGVSAQITPVTLGQQGMAPPEPSRKPWPDALGR